MITFINIIKKKKLLLSTRQFYIETLGLRTAGYGSTINMQNINTAGNIIIIDLLLGGYIYVLYNLIMMNVTQYPVQRH